MQSSVEDNIYALGKVLLRGPVSHMYSCRNTSCICKTVILLKWRLLKCNRVYCIHVPGHDPLIFSFLSFILFDWVGVLWPNYLSVRAEAGCLFAVAAGVHVFISGESLHCFLVGVQIKSYVIATSDL